MLKWLRKGMRGSAGMSGIAGALDDFFHPTGAQAREELQQQHERNIPVPSPGDKLLDEGKLVIRPTSRAETPDAERPK